MHLPLLLSITALSTAVMYLLLNRISNIKLRWRLMFTCAALIFSAANWIYLMGAEFGTVYWVCLTTLICWLIIVINSTRGERSKKTKSTKKINVSLKKVGKDVLWFLALLTAPALFSILLSFNIPAIFTDITANSLVLSFFMFLITWPFSIYFFSRLRVKSL